MSPIICHKCSKPIEQNEPRHYADINIGANAAGSGNFKPFHSACSPFTVWPFGHYEFQWQDG